MLKSVFIVLSLVSVVAPVIGEENPLLQSWAGPYGGVPPLADVAVRHFEPAFETAKAEYLEEIDTITAQRAGPTFDNTLAALERAGGTLDRVLRVYYIWSATMNSPEFQQVQRAMAPQLAALEDKVNQNQALFKRVAAIYDARETLDLSPEQQRLAWYYYMRFNRAGAQLDQAARERLSSINQRLAELYTAFSQNVLNDEEQYMLLLEAEADLAGLPDDLRATAATAAGSRGHAGKWAVLNTRSSMEPFLKFSERRDLRESVWRMYYSRGDNGDAHDNNATITEILKLRAERASLLGFATHAHWQIANQMAKTPDRALDLMLAVWEPAIARVHEEVADMQAVADREAAARGTPKFTIEPWDYRHYAEKVRKEKYDFDENEVKPYLQLENLREALFFVAGEVFGFEFQPVKEGSVPVPHSDVSVWEVRRGGEHVGLWYFDPYARQGKRSGAWMFPYRDQEKFDGTVTTIVSNNSNFVKGAAGEPVLVSWNDAETMFHEFGHALHGLASDVSYPSLAGTSVPRDYVEFPSQLLEYWLSTPRVLNRFALHADTGKPIPAELVARIESAATFNQGFDTTEYLASALIDLKIHLAGDTDIDPRAFERETLAELGMPAELVMRHRTPQFTHAFASDGYSSAYYSYLWADTLTADAAGAFTEAGGFYDRKVARRLRDTIFAVGNTVDPAEAYRNFRGRDARTDALMEKKGFPTKKSSAVAAD